MSNRFTTISASAALALAALTVSASADEAGTIHAAKTTGAMRIESGALATSYAGVQRQGGFVTPSAVHWTTTPVEVLTTGSIENAGSVGALSLETRGLATSFAEVRRQGGALTAGKVRWMSAPAR
ncbi:hypothetical protein [Methylobacterium haplocladii]|uniref:Uncharacterized protein n=1 Tax=Methylobacterium haplocladii TaxID=1176176 RepID=A0A512IQ81_9HYPH|nr:hypothetical protein [Methylobacterium haplocladii]GEO99847.1 hypothetical protein MHA02_22350 [Methylobacterium haplocladii]GJD84822.1 hypothetical protein HPGCJGGD_2705 [Methylobacterium haplocladii]GLS58011.1 hypothetical protein GCM10007887_06670 [Methylobacterium haplocladii]